MTISILGCGWLGLPLGAHLAKTHRVRGSVTTKEKLPLLQEQGITPFCIDLNAPDPVVLQAFLHQTDVLVIAIPPKAAVKSNLSYAERIKALLPPILLCGVKNVVFTSSISVYDEGVHLPTVDETTQPLPQTESGKMVLEAENILRQNTAFATTIIRLGGLAGAARHPVYHLAGKENLDNPLGPVNLVYLDECVNILTHIIEKERFGEVFVAVHPTNKNRSTFYTEQAEALGLPLPHFKVTAAAKGRIVRGQQKLMDLLNFYFT